MHTVKDFAAVNCVDSQKPVCKKHHEINFENKDGNMTGSIHIGLAAFAAALSVGLIGMKASEAVGRNPGASTKILVQSILSIAFAEAIVFYTLFLVR